MKEVLDVTECIADLKDYIEGLRARIRRNNEYVDAMKPSEESVNRITQSNLNTLDFMNELERIISCWEEGFRARHGVLI